MIPQRFRPYLPAVLAARMSARKRRRYLDSYLMAGRDDRAEAVLARLGTPNADVLWHVVNRALTQDGLHRLARFERFAVWLDPFGQAVFGALQAGGSGKDAAAQKLDALAEDQAFGPFERMCAGAWVLFLRLPRGRPGPGDGNSTLIQFWDQSVPPDEIATAMAAWQRLAGPGYQRFDDDSARAFLQSTFGSPEARLFQTAGHPAIRSDYFRLGFLAASGGTYVDADFAPHRDLDWDPGAAAHVLPFMTSRPRAHVMNGVLSAPAQHPYIVACFEEAGRRLASPDVPVQALAGGYMMTDVALSMFRRGALGDLFAVPDLALSDGFVAGVRTRYKDDDRNWRVWDRKRLAAR